MSTTASPTVSSMTATAYEALKEQLVLLDIAPGQPINEQELSSRLGVGRTPFREALKRLETDHLVVTFPRRGTFASSVDITALAEISEIRAALEPVAARAAARRADERDHVALATLRDRLSALPAETSARDHMDTDLQVHRALYSAAHNAHLETALLRYGNLATRIWSVAAPRLHDVGAHIVEHVELLDAVLDGDGDRAAELMSAHMAGFEKSIRTVL